MGRKAKRLVKGSLAAKRHMAKLRRLAIAARKARGPGWTGTMGKFRPKGAGTQKATGPGWSARYNPTASHDEGRRLGLFFGKKGKKLSYDEAGELSLEVATSNNILFRSEAQADDFRKGFTSGYEDAQLSGRSRRNPLTLNGGVKRVNPKRTTTPSQAMVEVKVWEERDRLHIELRHKFTGNTIAEWWDDDARQMFEDGFFKSGRDLDRSVIEYAQEMGLLAKGNPLTRDESNVILDKGREALDLAHRNLAAGFPVAGAMNAGMAFADAKTVETATPRTYASHRAQGAVLSREASGLIRTELDREARKSLGLKPNPLVMTVMGNPAHSEDQVRRAVIASGYTPADADQVVYEWATTGRLPTIVRAHLRSPIRMNHNPLRSREAWLFIKGSPGTMRDCWRSNRVGATLIVFHSDAIHPDTKAPMAWMWQAEGDRGRLASGRGFHSVDAAKRAASMWYETRFRRNHNPAMCQNPGHGHGAASGEPTHWIISPAPGKTRRDLFIPSFEGSFKAALQEARQYAAKHGVETQLWEADPASYRRQGWFKELWATVRPHGGHEIVRGRQRNPSGRQMNGPSIRTSYHGPTDTRGSRIFATASTGERLSIPYPHELSGEAVHRSAAEALARKLGWSGDLIAGDSAKGYVFVLVRKNPAKRNVPVQKGYKLLTYARGKNVKALVERLNRQGVVFYSQSASPSGGTSQAFFVLSRDFSLAQDVLKGHYGNPKRNPGKGRRRKVTMTLEAFERSIRAKNDPKLLAAFKRKVEAYRKWSHGTLPKKVTVEQVDVPGMSGIWMTYDAGKAPETAYVMPRGTKRKGAWIHQWDTMPDLKNDPESGIVLTKLKGKSRITNFYHR